MLRHQKNKAACPPTSTTHHQQSTSQLRQLISHNVSPAIRFDIPFSFLLEQVDCASSSLVFELPCQTTGTRRATKATSCFLADKIEICLHRLVDCPFCRKRDRVTVVSSCCNVFFLAFKTYKPASSLKVSVLPFNGLAGLSF